MHKKTDLPRVEVVWRDTSSSGGWKTLAAHRETRAPLLCRSTGYLLQRTSKVVHLLQSLDNNEKGSDDLIIPREVVHSIRRLK